ncbi:MAG: CPBP family intramembrane metalloprotease [Anaerolineales bacterium]|nr:CPBP family intramembrane metalloprotease [Anaerolineales bacterium]
MLAPFVQPGHRLFELARAGKRLPHIALAIPLTFVFVLAAQVGGGLPLLLAQWLVFGDRGLPRDQPLIHGAAIALFLVAAFGPIFILLALWLRLFEKRPLWTLGFERDGAAWKYARGLLVGGGMFAASVGLMLPFGYVAPEAGLPEREGWFALGGVLVIFLGWMVQGAAEEALTRGWLMNVIGARYRPWLGLLVSSLVFVVLHGLNPNIGALPLLNLFLFAVFAALYALWERSLWGICAAHAAWNWMQGNVFGLQVSGSAETGPMLFNLAEAGPDWFTGGAFGPEGGLAATVILALAIAALALLLALPRSAGP